MKLSSAALGLTLAGSAFVITPADAADINAPAPAAIKGEAVSAHDWTGAYIGIQGGGLWGGENIVFPGGNTRNHTDTRTDPEFSGGLFGGQAGAQQQFRNNIVAGAEISGVWSQAGGWAACPGRGYKCGAKLDAAYEIVGRLGYSWFNFLPYFKGGYAITNLESTVKPPYTGFNGNHSHDGWVIGGGLDYALTEYVVVGVDYSHVEADTQRYSPTAIVGVMRNVGADIDIVSGRVSYKFSPGYTPQK